MLFSITSRRTPLPTAMILKLSSPNGNSVNLKNHLLNVRIIFAPNQPTGQQLRTPSDGLSINILCIVSVTRIGTTTTYVL